MQFRRVLLSLLLLSLLTAFATACVTNAASPTVVPTQPPSAGSTATAASSGTATSTPTAVPPTNDWAKDAVFYEIFVRSFYDSDGDGIGDFRGLTEKLDYLNDGDPTTDTDLGVTGIWLMPIFPSPSYHGYDVTDYYTTNPEYGTLEDFQALLDAAHERGIRVIIDFVLNHTSDQHPWFQAAAAGDPQYRDFYLWSETKPTYRGPWDQEVWHLRNGSFYYGVFVKEMPDLNYNNPAVTAEMQKVAAYWLNEVGVDGFRLDGAKHLIEQGPVQENTSKTHAWFKDFRAFYQGVKPDALVVGEVWSPTSQMARYVNDGELDLVFNFTLAEDMLQSAAFQIGRRASNSINQQQRYFTDGPYAPFLANHDQPRVMTRLNGNVNAAKAAASMLLSAPGTPFLYYGEEIGMTGDKPDPDIRTPMQWTGGTNAGFTTGQPWRPANSDAAKGNVEDQTSDPGSLLSHYRRLIRARAELPALRHGEIVPAIPSDAKVYAALRVTEDETVLMLVNLAEAPLSGVTLEWAESPLRGTLQPSVILGEGQPAPLTVNDQGGVEGYLPLPELPANSTIIVRYQK